MRFSVLAVTRDFPWVLSGMLLGLIAGTCGAESSSEPVRPAEAAAGELDRLVPARENGSVSAPAPRTAPLQVALATTDAERIGQLKRTIQENEKRLAELQASLVNPDEEYAKAERDFIELDEQRAALQKLLQKERDAGHTDEVAALTPMWESLDKKWSLAKKRFDLAIQARKAVQETIATLQQTLPRDLDALNQMLGKMPPANSGEKGSASAPPEAAPGTPAAEALPAPPAESVAEPAVVEPAAAPALVSPLNPLASPAPAPPAAPEAAPPAPSEAAKVNSQSMLPPTQKTEDKQLLMASKAAEKKAMDAQLAEETVRSVTERMEILRKNISLERTLRDTAYQQVVNARELLHELNEEVHRGLTSGENVLGLQQQVRDAEKRLADAQGEARRVNVRLDELQTDLSRLQAEQLASLRDAELKQSEAEKAAKEVQQLRNPFSVRNLLQWFIDHGPRIVAILIAMSVFLWMSRLLENQLIRLMAARGRRGTREERENRAKTLISVFRNAANLLMVGGGMAMLLEEIGIPIGPLLGGAAVVGLAVAFGAQSLIKDYFTGFMVLLEQQYLINDVIRIGEISGQVERITLRATVLRDLQGQVHFIPHGQIATVTNLTHGWSNAVFDIGVAYRENVDRVIEVLLEISRELKQSSEFGQYILADASMLGVDSLADSAVVIKFLIKTRPLKQWLIKREMLRRIKNRFDELGIEIPFPHRTVFHRQEQAPGRFRDEQDDWDDKEAA